MLAQLFSSKEEKTFRKQLRNVLGFTPGKIEIYRIALSHRSVREKADENNERLEFLGDAVISTVVANYLFRLYPYKEEGFLTEMRSKMVNRNQLNDIAKKIGLHSITRYNRYDNALKISQIFGNTLEALVGAIFLDKGYEKTNQWICRRLITPYLFMEDLESIDLNIKNKLYGWASKNGKVLDFQTLDETKERGRRLFTVGAAIDGLVVAEGKGFNKKDASQKAAENAIEILDIK